MATTKCWAVVPQGTPGSEYYYGVRQLSDSYRLYIASGCCEARIVPRPNDYNAECIDCKRMYPISPNTGFRGEETPFELYWGQFAWDMVEDNMKQWLDFYFNFESRTMPGLPGGEVQLSFNGQHWNDFINNE